MAKPDKAVPTGQPAQNTPAEVLTVQPRKIEAMEPARMQDAEFMRAQKVAIAHANTLPEDLLRHDYWAHVAQSLSPWTRIEVRANDGSWLFEGVVRECGRNWAHVHCLNLYQLGNDTAKVNDAIAAEYAGLPYEVVYRGEFEQWSVIRKSDRAVIHDKEATKAGADRWMIERQKADKIAA